MKNVGRSPTINPGLSLSSWNEDRVAAQQTKSHGMTGSNLNTGSGYSTLAKVGKFLIVAGVFFGSGVTVGYLAANDSRGGDPTESISESPSTGSVDSALAILSKEIGSNLVLSGQITPVELNETINEFDAGKESWQDDYLSKSVMSAFLTLQNDSEGQGNRLGRNSLPKYNSALVDPTFEFLMSESVRFFFNKADAIKFESDASYVLRANGNMCYVMSEASIELQDWIQNLNLGFEDIMSLRTSTVKSVAQCGCKRFRWWWCAEAHTCQAYTKIGTGYKGFVRAFNGMRVKLWERIQNTCRSGDTIVLTGASRGAAIVQVLAYSIVKENLLPLERVKLVSFGAPRSLKNWESDYVHNKFEQWRLIYKQDIVPSIPYSWLGLKHFGEMRCYMCGYPETRDRPYFTASIPDHLGYPFGFGDKSLFL